MLSGAGAVSLLLLRADARSLPLADESVGCVVTSPPYWSLRDYGLAPLTWTDGWVGCLGLEPTPWLYLEHLVGIFAEVRRVMKARATLWLNIGDCYHSGDRGGYRLDHHRWENSQIQSGYRDRGGSGIAGSPNRLPQAGLKDKDLVGIPWRLALMLQADGWWLRSAIVWEKPNAMPSSVKDRPTSSYEFVFLLAKNKTYYYAQDAIREPHSANAHSRGHGVNLKCADPESATSPKQNSSWSASVRFIPCKICGEYHDPHEHDAQPLYGDRPRNVDSPYQAPGQPQHHGLHRATRGFDTRPDVPGQRPRRTKTVGPGPHVGGCRQAPEPGEPNAFHLLGRNARDVWRFPTQPTKLSHFATFPEELVRRCIMAGCPQRELVLDPFAGTGVVGKVAVELGRRAVLCDLAYHGLARRRCVEIQRPLLEEASH